MALVTVVWVLLVLLRGLGSGVPAKAQTTLNKWIYAEANATAAAVTEGGQP
jgi:hypothetical protein